MKMKVINDNGFKSVIATEKIKLGETIVSLPQKFKGTRDRYSIQVSHNLHVDCSDHIIGSINHNCDPSASVKHMRIIAWKCIEPGEEVTIDYRKTESHLSEYFKCSCCNELMEW